jgi:hypothetical protein
MRYFQYTGTGESFEELKDFLNGCAYINEKDNNPYVVSEGKSILVKPMDYAVELYGEYFMCNQMEYDLMIFAYGSEL